MKGQKIVQNLLGSAEGFPRSTPLERVQWTSCGDDPRDGDECDGGGSVLRQSLGRTI